MPPDPLQRHRRLEIGARLRTLRTERGLTQETFADAAGMHRTYVASVERGERNPSLDAIWALCDALGESPRVLFPEAPPVQSRQVRAR